MEHRRTLWAEGMHWRNRNCPGHDLRDNSFISPTLKEQKQSLKGHSSSSLHCDLSHCEVIAVKKGQLLGVSFVPKDRWITKIWSSPAAGLIWIRYRWLSSSSFGPRKQWVILTSGLKLCLCIYKDNNGVQTWLAFSIFSWGWWKSCLFCCFCYYESHAQRVYWATWHQRLDTRFHIHMSYNLVSPSYSVWRLDLLYATIILLYKIFPAEPVFYFSHHYWMLRDYYAEPYILSYTLTSAHRGSTRLYGI